MTLALSCWLREYDSVRLASQAGIVRFYENWTTGNNLVATLQRFLLQPCHRFVGIKGEMGRQQDVRQGEQAAQGVAGGRKGFLTEYIQTRSGDAPGNKRLDQGGFIHQSPA